MKSIEVADRYSQALYELGKEEGVMDELQDDLSEVDRVLDSHDELFSFLIHPLVPDADKKGILDDVFGESLLRETRNFLKILVEKNREDYLPLIYERFRKIRRDEEEIVEVEVTLPPGFDSEEVVEEVTSRLIEMMDKSVQVTEVREDEDLIGGIKLKVGEQVIDGSVRSRLEGLRDFVIEGGSDGRN